MTSSGSNTRGRVLVVDDEPMICIALERILSKQFHVETTTSSARALELILRDPNFHAVLCDVLMPAYSGIELYEQLKAQHPALAQRLIFLTGGAFSDDVRDFLDSVPNPSVQKPFDVDKLVSLVEQVAGSKG